MANRCALTNQIETLSGPLSAATYFDANWNNPVTALNDASLGYNNGIASDTGSANNYLVACPFGTPSSYNPGMPVDFIPANTNTGSSTLTVSPLAAASILDANGNALTAGAIVAGQLAHVVYISGAFRLGPSSVPSLVYSNPVVTVAGTTSINCLSAASVSICFDATGAPNSGIYTINVTSVRNGCHFAVQIFTSGGSQTFKWTGTDNAANTITDIKSYYPDGAAIASPSTNLITTGDNATNFLMYNGAYMFDTAASIARLRFTAAFA